jgi:hypothetical protein
LIIPREVRVDFLPLDDVELLVFVTKGSDTEGNVAICIGFKINEIICIGNTCFRKACMEMRRNGDGISSGRCVYANDAEDVLKRT